MTPENPNAKKRPPSKYLLPPRTEVLSCAQVEELYWFAMALTGDAEFAAKLVADAANRLSVGRGVLHT